LSFCHSPFFLRVQTVPCAFLSLSLHDALPISILTSSASLKADAVESALCGYLAWIALAGLAANAIWGKSWADPVAALPLTPLMVHEGWEAIHASQLECN